MMSTLHCVTSWHRLRGSVAQRRDPTSFLETFGAVRRCLSALAQQAYAELEIGATQAKFLRVVGDRPQISQAQLARATSTDPTLTGRGLATLIERGWVKRERSAEDRREYVLSLTAAGRRVRDKVEALREGMATRIVSSLSERDLEDFDRIAKKILDGLGQAADGAPDTR